MPNEKQYVSLRPNGAGLRSRLALFLCLGLIIVCLLLLYNLYDVIGQRDNLHEETNELRVRIRTCNTDKIECERKYEASLRKMKTQSEQDNIRIQQLEQSNAEQSSQTQAVSEQLKNLETKNRDAVQQNEALQQQLKSLETKNQDSNGQLQQKVDQFNDLQRRFEELEKTNQLQNAELNDVKGKLADNVQQLNSLKEALETEKLNKKAEEQLQNNMQQQTQPPVINDQQNQQPITSVFNDQNQRQPDGWNQLNQQSHQQEQKSVPPTITETPAAPNENTVATDDVLGASSPSVVANDENIVSSTLPSSTSVNDDQKPSEVNMVVPQSPAPAPIVDENDNEKNNKQLNVAAQKATENKDSDDDGGYDDTNNDTPQQTA